MSEQVTRDPALAKLIDNLPSGNPDEDKPQRIEVTMDFVAQRHIVERNREVTLTFGPWNGPAIPANHVVLRAVNLQTGNHQAIQLDGLCSGQWVQMGSPVMRLGGMITITDATFDL